MLTDHAVIPVRSRRLRHARAGCRAGRALIDVLVALAVLAVSAGATLTLVRSSVVATSRIAFVSESRALLRNVAEDVQAAPCATSAGTGRLAHSTVAWSASVEAPLVTVALTATAAAHPGAGVPPRALGALAAGWCR